MPETEVVRAVCPDNGEWVGLPIASQSEIHLPENRMIIQVLISPNDG